MCLAFMVIIFLLCTKRGSRAAFYAMELALVGSSKMDTVILPIICRLELFTAAEAVCRVMLVF